MATSPCTAPSVAFPSGCMPPLASTGPSVGDVLPPVPAAEACAKTAPRPAANKVTGGLEISPLDAAAREKVLLEHMPIVRFVARRIHERLPQHVELQDLVGAGILGLMDAWQKFDTRKNVQFRSYAQFRIRGAILDSLRILDWGPRDLRRKGREIEVAVQSLTTRLGRRPSETEIALELGIPLDAYQQLLGELRGLEIASLNGPRSEDPSEQDLAHVPASPEEDPLAQCMKKEMAERLAAGMTTLPEREAMVLSLYYVEEMTMKEIGARLGVVESRVSQMRSAALTRLRQRLTQRDPAVPRPAARTFEPRQPARASSRAGINVSGRQRVAAGSCNAGRPVPR